MYSDRQRVEQILKRFQTLEMKFTHQRIRAHRSPRAHRRSVEKRPERPRNARGGVRGDGHGHRHSAKDKRLIIFEAFQQADGTTSPEIRRHGVGLSITRSRPNSGGELQAQSAEGVGSTFTLFLTDTPVAMRRKPPNLYAETPPRRRLFAASACRAAREWK